MTKYLLHRWFQLFILNAAIVFVEIILLVFFRIPFNFLGCGIFSSIFSSTAIGIFLAVMDGIWSKEILKGHSNFYKEWKIDTSVQIRYKQIFVRLLPVLFIAVGLALLAILKCSDLDAFYARKSADDRWDIAVAALVGFMAMIVTAILHFFYFIYTAVSFYQLRCPQCGCIFGYECVDKSDYEFSERDETKTKDNYGVVGKWYTEDGDFVKDEIGRTGSTTFTRTVKTSSWTVHLTCVYCGHKLNKRTGDTYYGDWQTK